MNKTIKCKEAEMMIYAEEYRKQNDNLMGSVLTKLPPSLNYCQMCPVGTAGMYVSGGAMCYQESG